MLQAPNYPAVGPSEKTVAGSKVQNELLVEDCFKDGECAHLFLVQKLPRNSLVSESERKAIVSKTGKRKRQKWSGGGGDTLGMTLVGTIWVAFWCILPRKLGWSVTGIFSSAKQ